MREAERGGVGGGGSREGEEEVPIFSFMKFFLFMYYMILNLINSNCCLQYLSFWA